MVYAAAVLLRRSHGSAMRAAIAPRRSPASAPITAALRLLVADARTATAGCTTRESSTFSANESN
jgi:hypothetical protein